MIPRILEPEAMDTPEEARDYDAMDFLGVNSRFVGDFLAFHGPCRGGTLLDVGTGTARIPILLCRDDAGARLLGADLAEQMLRVARRNVDDAGLGGRIQLDRVDGKQLPYEPGTFEAVLSNTIIHHVPEPITVLREMARLVAPGGSIFCRDLTRPDSKEDLDRLVETYTQGEPDAARALFRDSLHAALTLDEARELVASLGLPPEGIAMTSDRHWTWSYRRPG